MQKNKNISAPFSLTFVLLFLSFSSSFPANFDDPQGPGMGIRLSKDGFNLVVNSFLLPWIF